MLARELMKTDVFTVQEDAPVENLMDILIGEHIHGAPVLSRNGDLVGVVSQQDVFFGAATRSEGKPDQSGPPLAVRDIMTSPAVSAGEEAPIQAVCGLMHKLRIHRVPILREKKVVGIISTLDVCAAVASGEKLD